MLGGRSGASMNLYVSDASFYSPFYRKRIYLPLTLQSPIKSQALFVSWFVGAYVFI